MALNALIRDRRINAIVGWVMAGIAIFGGAGSFLSNALLWGVFSLLMVAVASLPAIVNRDWTAMVSWPVLVIMSLVISARVGNLYSEVAGHLAIATLALIIVVELTTFTTVELSRRFAAVFAVLTTMALQALWIVAQFYSDRWLATRFLSTQTELQKDIVLVTLVGFVVGGVFEWYFARFEPVGAVKYSSDWVAKS